MEETCINGEGKREEQKQSSGEEMVLMRRWLQKQGSWKIWCLEGKNVLIFEYVITFWS